MAQATKQFIVDENGEKTAVILPIGEYHELLEEIEDLAIIGERRGELTELLSAVKKRLVGRRNGKADRHENQYTAIVRQSGVWWIGWIEEVPGVTCQEATREELLETLKITLNEALEFNKEGAIAAMEGDYQEELIVA